MGLGDFFSGVCEIVSNVCSTISSSLNSVVSTTLSSFAKFLPVVGNIVVAVQIVSSIANIVAKVANALGLLTNDSKIDEIGAKAMQEGTRKQGENESAEDYLNYLKNDVVLDKDKFEKSSIEDKYVQNSLGASIVSQAISEKTGVNLTGDFLLGIDKLKMDFKDVFSLIKFFSSNQIGSMDSFLAYLKNNLNEKDANLVGNTVFNSIKDVHPKMTDSEIKEEILKMKQNIN